MNIGKVFGGIVLIILGILAYLFLTGAALKYIVGIILVVLGIYLLIGGFKKKGGTPPSQQPPQQQPPMGQ